jgi:hypothetical protein
MTSSAPAPCPNPESGIEVTKLILCEARAFRRPDYSENLDGGEPVLSVHRRPADGQRMATAGADNVVRVRANFNFHSVLLLRSFQINPAIHIHHSGSFMYWNSYRLVHN